MKLPRDLENLITDYYVSIIMHEMRQKTNTEFRKRNMVLELQSFHTTTLIGGSFSPKFCLAVLYYMNNNRLFMMM